MNFDDSGHDRETKTCSIRAGMISTNEPLAERREIGCGQASPFIPDTDAGIRADGNHDAAARRRDPQRVFHQIRNRRYEHFLDSGNGRLALDDQLDLPALLGRQRREAVDHIRRNLEE